MARCHCVLCDLHYSNKSIVYEVQVTNRLNGWKEWGYICHHCNAREWRHEFNAIHRDYTMRWLLKVSFGPWAGFASRNILAHPIVGDRIVIQLRIGESVAGLYARFIFPQTKACLGEVLTSFL